MRGCLIRCLFGRAQRSSPASASTTQSLSASTCGHDDSSSLRLEAGISFSLYRMKKRRRMRRRRRRKKHTRDSYASTQLEDVASLDKMSSALGEEKVGHDGGAGPHDLPRLAEVVDGIPEAARHSHGIASSLCRKAEIAHGILGVVCPSLDLHDSPLWRRSSLQDLTSSPSSSSCPSPPADPPCLVLSTPAESNKERVYHRAMMPNRDIYSRCCSTATRSQHRISSRSSPVALRGESARE